MKRYILLATVLALALVVAFIAGCSTQPINKKYGSQLSQLKPGTSLSEFRQILPKAAVAGQNSVDGLRVDAYEITHNYMYDSWNGFTRTERLWFYFYNETLVKWGPPGSWPVKADLVIEQRKR